MEVKTHALASHSESVPNGKDAKEDHMITDEPHSDMTRFNPYELDLEAAGDQAKIGSLLDGEDGKKRAIERKRPKDAISDHHFQLIARLYLQARLHIKPGFSGHHMRIFNSTKAPGYKLCAKNVRYLLGLAHECLSPEFRHTLSLEMLCEPKMLELVCEVLQARGRGQRGYQIGLELRCILLYVLDKAHAHLSQKQRSEIFIDRFPAWQMIDQLIRSNGVDRKQQDKINRHKDEKTLIEEGKLLSRQDLDKYIHRLEAFFQEPDADPVTPLAAYRYQQYLIAYILSGAIGAVLRGHVLVQLHVGREIFLDKDLDGWVCRSTCLGKGQAPLEVHWSSRANKVFASWFDKYRPCLVRHLKEDHHLAFVQKDGKPRASITKIVNQVTETLIGRSISAHRFRARQVIDLHEDQAAPNVQAAFCAGRQHSAQTAARYYHPKNVSQDASLVKTYLDSKRQTQVPVPIPKRPREILEGDRGADQAKRPRYVELLDEESSMGDGDGFEEQKTRRRKHREDDDGEFPDF